MKRIFLTGSKGFIGQHLYERIKHDYDVYCAGKNELPDYEYDYIIHLAATTTTSKEFLPELFENNIVYAKEIMSYPIRTIYASSTSASELINPYAYTKNYIEWLGQNHVNATGLRFFNVYGPNNNKGIVKHAIDCALSGKRIELYGGAAIRDFIYIDDVVDAIINSLDSSEKIIEIGTGVGTKVGDAVKLIYDMMDKPLNYIIYDNRSTDMRISVAKKAIGNCIALEDGIRKMLNK